MTLAPAVEGAGRALVAEGAALVVDGRHCAYMSAAELNWSTAGALDRVHQIGPLPGEAAVLFRRPAEMPVGGGAAIDRPAQLERAPDVRRAQRKELRENLLKRLLGDQ